MTTELSIGTVRETDRPAHLEATRLNRHTFWCGQSGSGKTYALGVLLEQVLLHTALPIIVLDPNADFVRMSEVRPDAPAEDAATLATRDIRVLSVTPSPAQELLQVRFLDLPGRSRTAILQLDPVLDAEDFHTALEIEADLRGGLDQPLLPYLRSSDDPGRHRIAMRLQNLGVADWQLWAWGGRDVTDVVDERPDATVLDLAGFPTSAEMQAAALAVLDHLWAHRLERVGRLVVIDEAHNLCPPDPSTPLQRALVERIIQIAAEGRKYGIWLLLSTQRPSKIHVNVLSQCDNLALMKTASPRDLGELRELFGYAPEELVSAAPAFGKGQALFAGGFSAEPQLVQMGSRLTEEGGGDVAIPIR